jgi:hypothetical protein
MEGKERRAQAHTQSKAPLTWQAETAEQVAVPDDTTAF